MKLRLLAALGALSVSPIWAQSIQLGSSSNAFTILRPEQNQVIANNATNTVVFIHRQDVTQAGGSAADNGKLQYDISVDGGTSWTVNLGILNSLYSRAARYPQITMYNPNDNTDPSASYLVWSAPTLGPLTTDSWIGQVNGVAQTTTSTVTSTENYQFQTTSSLLPGGLCEGAPGIFWNVEAQRTGEDLTDTIVLYKGTWNQATEDVNWVVAERFGLPNYKGFDGLPKIIGPNVSFSPDGQTGWIAFLGDLVGGIDSVYSPVFLKSTDGGTTWSAPVEVAINNFQNIYDSIGSVAFSDGLGGILAMSQLSTGFDFDLTVDAQGNPHLFTTAMAGEIVDETGAAGGNGKGYTVYSAFNKAGIDVTSNDQGVTFNARYVAQINTFRTTFGLAEDAVSVDANHQISRTPDGTKIFYAWSDTDTLIYPDPEGGDNTNPNVRVMGYRLSDGFITCWKRTEALGVANEDRVLAPTMSPVVLENGNTYTLPIVTGEILTGPQNPIVFHYLGNNTKFCDEDFKDPSTLNISWVFAGSCYNFLGCGSYVGIDESIAPSSITLYPNPATDWVHVTLPEQTEIQSATVVNMLGQTVLYANKNQLSIDGQTLRLDVNRLAAGVYTLTLQTGNKALSGKITIQR